MHNHMENKQCPNCGYKEKVWIHPQVRIPLWDEGLRPEDDDASDLHNIGYDDTTFSMCPECHHEGVLGDWDTGKNKRKNKKS